MKKIGLVSLFIFLYFFQLKSQYDSKNIKLIGHWENPSTQAEQVFGIRYNSVWGWYDSLKQKEYAILGATDGTYIIDITTPSNPTVKDFVPGRRDKCIWREYKTYRNYLYAISDDASPNSFQIMDLSYLPDSVKIVYDDTTLFERSHTLFIDNDKLYCAIVRPPNLNNYYSMGVFSLSNPELPSLIRYLNDDYPIITGVHDMFVRNDTIYASAGYQGLYIFELINNQFILLNSLTSYPNQGYNHSSALTPNGNTLVFCDEVPANMAIKVIDIKDIQNINIESIFKSNEGATPHNPYIYGNDKAVIAYYQDGLQIFDISNPTMPVKTGFFDTDTLKGQNDGYSNPPYHGCWGAYIHLPSKNILASDMQNGLYVLDAKKALGIKDKPQNFFSIYPNPTNSTFELNIELINEEEITFILYDICGKEIMNSREKIVSGKSIKNFNIETLANGIYIFEAHGTVINFTKKIVKN